MAGASPYGALDMAGNVWQWTSSNYGGIDASIASLRVLRGGSWNIINPDNFRSAYRIVNVFRYNIGGFRGAS